LVVKHNGQSVKVTEQLSFENCLVSDEQRKL